MRKCASSNEELNHLIEKEEVNLSSSTQPPSETRPHQSDGSPMG